MPGTPGTVPPTTTAATPDGGRIAVWVAGEGEPLLLIAGMSVDHRTWTPQLTGPGALTEHFQVITYDARGTGESSDFDTHDSSYVMDPPTTGTMATDAREVLRHLGIERAHVMGHSMGGRVAQWFAISHAKALGALVLLGTSGGESQGVPRTPEADRKLLSLNPVDLDLMNYSAGWLTKHVDLAKTMSRAVTKRAAQRQVHYNASHAHDSWHVLDRISAPTLVLHGSEDQLNPVANGELLARMMPNARLHTVRGGRHGMHAEYAAEVNRVVTQFLQQHPLS